MNISMVGVCFICKITIAPHNCMPAQIIRAGSDPGQLFCAQYLYNLEVYGHKEYTRRDKSELEQAQSKVDSRAATGDLGPLSPLE